MSRKTACSTVFLAIFLAFSASLVVPASAQHFVQVKGTVETISAGRNEVFGIDHSQHVWRYHATTKSFAKIAKPLLSQVAVGGGTLSQLDEVWGLNSTGSIYRFNYTTKAFAQVPGTLTQITVGLGITDNCHPYEVWGLNSSVIYRFNYCTNGFDIINGVLVQVATGGGDVWGLNSAGSVFHVNQLDSPTPTFVQVPGNLFQIAVGVNDVWGVDVSADIFRYNFGSGAFQKLNSGVVQVAAGGDGVWFLDLSGNPATIYSATGSALGVQGTTFKTLAVGSGAGVFGIRNLDQVFTFVRP
jgi:Tectonin domain